MVDISQKFVALSEYINFKVQNFFISHERTFVRQSYLGSQDYRAVLLLVNMLRSCAKKDFSA